ncbi:hypothetical protein L596_024154 [Steinernema carpocapsae]|uniref:Uncharacterized protein n=1 Tax=Steinernema carpocapsae TaxID=34508 RepID=A0A4V5ZZL9_STECR|nr:hypothetical protein L596_024154 [Steinernema carpocapsae]
MTARTVAQDKEVLEKANKLKDEANMFYSKQDYVNAANCYHRCLLLAKSCGVTPVAEMMVSAFTSDDSEAERVARGPEKSESDERAPLQTAVSEVVSKCYNNLAACILARSDRKPSDYERAIEYCKKVLTSDADNEKALYRSGIAYMRMEKYSKAVEFLSKCPNNRDAALQINACEQKLREDRRARDEAIRKNFAKAHAREDAQRNNRNPPSNGNLLQ